MCTYGAKTLMSHGGSMELMALLNVITRIAFSNSIFSIGLELFPDFCIGRISLGPLTIVQSLT